MFLFLNRRRRFLCFAFWEKTKVDEDLNENAFGEKKEKKMQKDVLVFYLQVALVDFIYLQLETKIP